MSNNKPIFALAKEMGIDSNRIVLACKTIGIAAKGSTKRLNSHEIQKIKNHFESGKNVSQETIEISSEKKIPSKKISSIKTDKPGTYFPNRLIG